MNLRRWQKRGHETLRALLKQKSDRALFAASPGAGKTHFTGTVLTNPYINCNAEIFVIVVPTRALKRQWKTALRKVNLSARDDIDNATLRAAKNRRAAMFDPQFPVHIYTYNQIQTDQEIFATLCSRYRVYVVFDEIHHADDDEKFGRALIVAFSEAVFKLSLTGTPFNTKGGTLAFCETVEKVDDEGKRYRETKLDFDYSYGDALAATGEEDDPYVVRPVTFLGSNGKAWREYINTETGERFTKEYAGKRKTDPLTPLLDVNEPYLQSMLSAGLSKLNEVREHHKNAAMLITAIDGDHARSIAAYMEKELKVKDYKVILFDTPGAHDEIERFEKSSDRVLIAVKIVSEGVDIKRLRVGVFASNVTTFLFFLQFVGRFIRWDASLGVDQRAYVVIPKHVVVESFAEKIEQMIAAAYLPDETGGGSGPGEPKNKVIDSGAEWSPGDVIEHGKRIEKDERADLEAFMREEFGVINFSFEDARRIRDKWQGRTFTPASSEPEDASAKEWETYYKNNDKLVAKIAVIAEQKGRFDLSYARIQTRANNAVGIEKKDKLTTLPILKKRHAFLKRLLSSLYFGSTTDGAA